LLVSFGLSVGHYVPHNSRLPRRNLLNKKKQFSIEALKQAALPRETFKTLLTYEEDIPC
jgi:hypothetical protein